MRNHANAPGVAVVRADINLRHPGDGRDPSAMVGGDVLTILYRDGIPWFVEL
jgi:hypothetical protein